MQSASCESKKAPGGVRVVVNGTGVSGQIVASALKASACEAWRE
jgi:hypothetical protein